MVAALEIVKDKVSFFSRRQIPWHGLGQVVTDDITTTEDVLKLANLHGWELQLRDFNRLLPANVSTHTDKQLVIRVNPFFDINQLGDPDYDQSEFNMLGIVGSRYQLVTNEELAAFAEQLLTGGRWETAGALRHGATVFMTMALDSELIIDEHGANDVINSYVVVSNTHDGTGKLTAAATNVRVECANTLDIAIRGAAQKVVITHTKSLDERMKEAQRTLALTRKYNVVFAEAATELFEAPVSNKLFFDVVETIYPEPDPEKKAAVTRWTNKLETLEAIWNSDTIEKIAGTGWGLFNTLEEQLQWDRGIYKGEDNGTENFWAAASGFDDVVSKAKTQMFNTVQSLVLN